jgi:hypothetical protein
LLALVSTLGACFLVAPIPPAGAPDAGPATPAALDAGPSDGAASPDVSGDGGVPIDDRSVENPADAASPPADAPSDAARPVADAGLTPPDVAEGGVAPADDASVDAGPGTDAAVTPPDVAEGGVAPADDASVDAATDTTAGTDMWTVGEGPAVPLVTAVGTPMGAAVTAMIGPEGGTLTSSDGRFTLTIPAGALVAPTAIGIQPIVNTAPQGLGLAYSLTPDGLRLATPATETLRYADAEVDDSAPELLGMAVQNADNTWSTEPGGTLDTAAHTLAVPILHFSDHAPYERCHIVQDYNTMLTSTYGVPASNEYVTFTIQCTGSQRDTGPDSAPLPLTGPRNTPADWESLTVVRVCSANGVQGGNATNGFVGTNVTGSEQSQYRPPEAEPPANPVRVDFVLNATDSSRHSLRPIRLHGQVHVMARHWRLTDDAMAVNNPATPTTCTQFSPAAARFTLQCPPLNLEFEVVGNSSTGLTLELRTPTPDQVNMLTAGPTSVCPTVWEATADGPMPHNTLTTLSGTVNVGTSEMTDLTVTGQAATAPGIRWVNLLSRAVTIAPAMAGPHTGYIPNFVPYDGYTHPYSRSGVQHNYTLHYAMSGR